MENGESFFDFAAFAGYTKHMGSNKSTQELAALCHIGEGSYVLDVGCGGGVTACFLVKKYGCRIAGIDIREGMVTRSHELAKREGVQDSVEFRVGDAQDIPFEDDLFDAVITESVTSFPEDQQLAVSEYARVTKPGGYVGLNESTWLKTPPPPEVVAWAAQDVGASVNPLTAEQWVGLLQNAGLQDISASTREINLRDEARGMMQRYGFKEMLRVWGRMLQLYKRKPAYRKFLKGLRDSGVAPENLYEYFGYGLYVGRK